MLASINGLVHPEIALQEKEESCMAHIVKGRSNKMFELHPAANELQHLFPGKHQGQNGARWPLS